MANRVQSRSALDDRQKNLIAIGAMAGAYFVAGKLGLSMALVHPSSTAVWPPSGIVLAAFLILGYRLWPGVALGAFLVNITTAGSWRHTWYHGSRAEQGASTACKTH